MDENKNLEPEQQSQNIPKEIIVVDETFVPEIRSSNCCKTN